MDTTNVRWPDSLWAAVTPQGPELPELTGTQQADVIVILSCGHLIVLVSLVS